jgi:uncharacterized protein YfdQ (DUF2303 family)
MDDDNFDKNNAQTILDAGKGLAAKVQDVAGIPCIVTPTGCEPARSAIDLADARADKPRRRKGTANLQSIDSFTDHVNRFKGGPSAIFADAANRKFLGVLNYHPAGAEQSDAAWGDHRAVYPCPLSPEWSMWGGGSEKSLGQDAFAFFLDEHDADLAAGAADAKGKPYPSPADLMTLAAALESYSNTSAKRERDKTTGRVLVSFSEDSGIKGNVTIPAAFAIKIPVFTDSAPAVLEVRLRVEVENGKPVFKFAIHDGVKVLRTAFDALVARVREATALPVLVGTPEQ